jgi:histidine ammonia-lyase
MITIKHPGDINWQSVHAIAYRSEPLEIDEKLLARVDEGRAAFIRLIEQGLPCYGVTTGLGQLANRDLSEAEQNDLPANMLRGRAAAIGPPLGKQIARANMLLRLVNFVSGLDGVSADLCRYIVDRLNDDFIGWIPKLGHGMASDAIANTHAFQTLIGEGFVFGADNERQNASDALAVRDLKPYVVAQKEGLALISGVTASPAYALDAHRQIKQLLTLANLVAAVSMEGLAAPKDSVDPVIGIANNEPGVDKICGELHRYLCNSQIQPHKMQAPVSYRIIPQVHGALYDALQQLRARIEQTFRGFSDNPLMVASDNLTDGRLLSVGLFHNQHLVNQVEQVALALAHLGCLSERRLHRLMNSEITGLNPQLAARPGLDAGLIVTHKASLDLTARLRLLAQPVSLSTAESSGGQEDYMSMVFPAIDRLYQMCDLVNAILAYELLSGLTAASQRDEIGGDAVCATRSYFNGIIMALDKDRSPGPDVELIIQEFDSAAFKAMLEAL